MFQFILSSFYFFIPAYFTNMTPPVARKTGVFKFLNKPVDFGKRFRGERILGSHKTWRGAILGIIVGIIIIYFQAWLYQFSSIREISFFNYQKINILFLGFLISGGAVFGDLLFAFIKRRWGLKPGAKFLPFDQTNYVIGAAIFLTPFFKIDSLAWLILLILSFFLHMIATRIGYYLNINRSKW
ncbi:MAG: CDP-archaeol synthase [Patescibacteria group bacterium]|nr:CDP-archaeol synthase [Patescibacteria group bacterium]